MMPASNTAQGGIGRPKEGWILAATGLIGLIPYAAYHELFARLFWFGDDIDMFDQIDRLGFWHWVFTAYAENFVPLFKLVWGGSAFASGGSYAAMITVVWLTHAINVALLGKLMRTCGLSWSAVIFAQAIFGLTPANTETLGWSVQLASMLSVTFLVLALDAFFRSPYSRAAIGWASASVLSFSRGALTGLLVAFAALLPAEGEPKAGFSRRAAFAAASLTPAIAVALLIVMLAPGGNEHHMAGHWGDAVVFGIWNFLLNPAYHLLRVESWGPRTVILLGLIKVSVIACAIAQSRGRSRQLFLTLLVFDMGSSALLGIGRYHTGLTSTISSRYQYAPLLAILPAAGFLFARITEFAPGPGFVRLAIRGMLIASIACSLLGLWPDYLDGFSSVRGTDNRRILVDDPNPGEFAVPGYPGFPTQRARDLIAKYKLH
jgi:hypothetical protein